METEIESKIEEYNKFLDWVKTQLETGLIEKYGNYSLKDKTEKDMARSIILYRVNDKGEEIETWLIEVCFKDGYYNKRSGDVFMVSWQEHLWPKELINFLKKLKREIVEAKVGEFNLSFCEFPEISCSVAKYEKKYL